MELLGLRTFKAAVDEGGVKGASEKLNTVPSNITARVQKLEEELGAKLFRLSGRKLEMTDTGRILYDYANQILQLEYQASLAVHSSKERYELCIGAPETFTAVHLPPVLKKLKSEHPRIRPRIYTATSAQLMVAVLGNKVDCALVGNALAHETLNVIPVVAEQLVLVTPRDGVHEPLLFVREDGCGYRKWAQVWQQDTGRANEETMVMSSADGILGCVAAGLGYTLIGRDMVRGSRYEKSLHIQPIETQWQYLTLSLVYPRNSPFEQDILNLARLFPESAQLSRSSRQPDA